MLPRFLADAIDRAAQTARLGADETRHLSHVLRLGAGDEVIVFDGEGAEFRARVDRVSRDAADLAIVEQTAAAPEPAVRLTLAQAALKGDKMDGLIRDATMMGVAAIEPLVTAHTVAHLKPGASPDRWHRIAVSSAKQCRRAVVPRIGAGVTFDDWLARDVAELKILLVEPAAAEYAEYAELKPEPPASATILVGPEGGWSTEEIRKARAAGCRTLTLGRRTLRADAVPIVAISVLQYLWRDL
jgi:16S rRNA (uracil1498-N3)-methyltransferase